MAVVKKSNYTYTGDVDSLGRPHGKGKVVFIDGSSYSGSFKDGLRNGDGVYYYAASNPRYSYEGSYLNDKMEGYGFLTYRNGDRFEGNFKQGKKHGWGTYYINKRGDGSRAAYYEGMYHMGLKYGKFTHRDKYGSVRFTYEHEWSGDAPEKKPEPPKPRISSLIPTESELQSRLNEIQKNRNPADRKSLGKDSGDYYIGPKSASGLPHGRGKYRYSTGEEYSGDFYYGKLQGNGWYTFKDGSHYEGEFSNGLEHGKGKLVPKDWQGFGFKWATTSLISGTWENGVLSKGEILYKKQGEDGATEKYVGELARGTYFPHGKGVYTEKDGSRYEGCFEMGKRHGHGVYYRASDGSTYRGSWEHGVRHGYGELTYRNESDYYGWKNKKGVWKNDVFVG